MIADTKKNVINQKSYSYNIGIPSNAALEIFEVMIQKFVKTPKKYIVSIDVTNFSKFCEMNLFDNPPNS